MGIVELLELDVNEAFNWADERALDFIASFDLGFDEIDQFVQKHRTNIFLKKLVFLKVRVEFMVKRVCEVFFNVENCQGRKGCMMREAYLDRPQSANFPLF